MRPQAIVRRSTSDRKTQRAEQKYLRHPTTLCATQRSYWEARETRRVGMVALDNAPRVRASVRNVFSDAKIFALWRAFTAQTRNERPGSPPTSKRVQAGGYRHAPAPHHANNSVQVRACRHQISCFFMYMLQSMCVRMHVQAPGLMRQFRVSHAPLCRRRASRFLSAAPTRSASCGQHQQMVDTQAETQNKGGYKREVSDSAERNGTIHRTNGLSGRQKVFLREGLGSCQGNRLPAAYARGVREIIITNIHVTARGTPCQ